VKLELWQRFRWLLGFWGLIFVASAGFAASRVTLPITAEQQTRIENAPVELLRALKLEPITFQPLKPGESRFISLTDLYGDQKCATFTENASSLERQLRTLPGTVFLLSSPFITMKTQVRFGWTIQDNHGVTYIGSLALQKRLLCLKPYFPKFVKTPILEQWWSKFVLLSVLAVPVHLIGLAVFASISFINAKAIILNVFGGLLMIAAIGFALYVFSIYFMWSMYR
jgi:hypothetical protein